MSLRALHIVNEPSGPGGLFLPPLESRGFAIDSVDTAREPLPDTLAGYDAVISCGGTANTHENDIYTWIDPQIELLRGALDDGVPVIGLCLGAQLLTKAAGGSVYRCDPSEVGWVEVQTNGTAKTDPVLGAVPESFMAMQWHRYACELPPGAVELGRNSTCLQAFRLGEVAWGTQFHIEVTRDILLTWARWGGEDLAQAGYSQERYMEELERHLPPHEEIGRGMAERFAEIAATRARSAA
jgi:GMP synthase-like glutamine amidotransferase